ncbi:hypothetical protein THAOC_23773, partial [Thalassiosira oceanica]
MIRVLLLSLELDREPFSGNGVLATSLLNGLRRRADADVRAICLRARRRKRLRETSRRRRRRRLAGPAAGPLQVEAAGQGGAVG